jgi:DUF1680 family protein
MEQLDQPDGVSITDVALDLNQKSPAQFHDEFKSDLLAGVVVLHGAGFAYERPASRSSLYSRYNGAPAKTRQVPLTFIPYYAWANRAATPMQVWTPLLKT